MPEYYDSYYQRPPCQRMPFYPQFQQYGQQLRPIDELPGFPFSPQSDPPPSFPFSPPFGPPSGPPSSQHGGASGPPSGPPPSFTPQQAQGISAFAVDPGAIRPCLFRYTYIWLNNGEQFWAWPIFLGRNSIAGWRWHRNRWVYFGIDLRRIRSFICY